MVNKAVNELGGGTWVAKQSDDLHVDWPFRLVHVGQLKYARQKTDPLSWVGLLIVLFSKHYPLF
jgi:hypothetical protein